MARYTAMRCLDLFSIFTSIQTGFPARTDPLLALVDNEKGTASAVCDPECNARRMARAAILQCAKAEPILMDLRNWFIHYTPGTVIQVKSPPADVTSPFHSSFDY